MIYIITIVAKGLTYQSLGSLHRHAHGFPSDFSYEQRIALYRPWEGQSCRWAHFTFKAGSSGCSHGILVILQIEARCDRTTSVVKFEPQEAAPQPTWGILPQNQLDWFLLWKGYAVIRDGAIEDKQEAIQIQTRGNIWGNHFCWGVSFSDVCLLEVCHTSWNSSKCPGVVLRPLTIQFKLHWQRCTDLLFAEKQIGHGLAL